MLLNIVKTAILRVLDEKGVSHFTVNHKIVCNDSVENHKTSFDNALCSKGVAEGSKYVWHITLTPMDTVGITVTLDVESDTFEVVAKR